jgi:hypothetical protein
LAEKLLVSRPAKMGAPQGMPGARKGRSRGDIQIFLRKQRLAAHEKRTNIAHPVQEVAATSPESRYPKMYEHRNEAAA